LLALFFRDFIGISAISCGFYKQRLGATSSPGVVQ